MAHSGIIVLSKTAQGTFDALVSGSYKPARAEILLYPPDAGTVKKSEWRVMQVEYIIVITSKDPYIFNGKIETLPEPSKPAGLFHCG